MSRIKHFRSLTKQKDFDTVYRRATKVWHSPFFVLFYQDSPNYQVAFVAGKKIGKAVYRNRAKRLLRALFIEQLESLKSGKYILVAKAPLPSAPYKKLEKEWLFALKRVKLIKLSK